jgi:serine/threonine-protein kinase HipA
MDKIQAAKISLWGETVGYISMDANADHGIFEFEKDYPLNISPINMPIGGLTNRFSFPNLSRSSFHGLPGTFADMLPDDFGNALINAWLEQQGRTPGGFSPIERLCYTGTRGMGALEFTPAVREGLNTSSQVIIDKLIDLTRTILHQRSSLNTNLDKDEDALLDIVKIGTSAGGARPKAVIAYNKVTGDIFSGQVDAPEGYEHYLIKFDGIEHESYYGRIEYTYFQMAQEAGIIMSPSFLLEEHGRQHFTTKRFDRIGNDKVHMNTLCGLAHYDFKLAGAYSYEQAFAVLRRINAPYEDHEQLFKRMVFNVIGRNQDDHTKNISFLMDKKGVWRLSPAYDISYSYNPKGLWTNQHQMTINGKRDALTRNDLLSVAKHAEVDDAEKTINDVLKVCSDWEDFACKNDVPQNIISSATSNLRLDI